MTIFSFPPFFFLALISARWASAAVVEINNTEPKKDITGHLMDVHDGKIVQWRSGEDFFWYGMGYGNCTEKRTLIPPRDCPGIYLPPGHCGFRIDHRINIYTSKDLVNWKFQGEALTVEDRPEAILFRPKVVFNARTQLYVLWVNFLPKDVIVMMAYRKATLLVATSKSPIGPFKIVRQKASLQYGGPGDFDLFVDTDGTGYVAYDAWSNSHRVVIEKLSDDFQDSLGAAASTGPVSPPSNEAPIMFQRSGWYYLLFGHTCCFCRSGSNAAVWVSTHPLGPWNSTGIDIGGKPGIVDGGTSYTKTQESFIFEVAVEGGNIEYIWSGDRWGSAPDGLKSHDLQYWQPLSFDDTVSPPTIAKTHFLSSFKLAIPSFKDVMI